MTALADPQDMPPDIAPIHDTIDNRTRWAAFLTILIAQFMNLIDVTIVNVALPSLQSGLGATESQIEWVVAGYILVFALGLLPMGRYGDIVGRKRLFLYGVAAFTGASALCGVAPSIEFLVAARVIQGAAGAVMMPQVMAIAQNLFPPRARGGAFALFGLTAGLASVTGPILGGALINADLWGLGWRPIFLINLPIGLFALVAASRLIPDLPGDRSLRNDWGGIAFIAAAMLALIFPLVEGRALGWPWWCFALMIASAPLFVGFVLWEARQNRRGQAQVMPISLLKAWNFALGGAMSMVYFSAMPALFLVLALFLQQGFGFDPLTSGLTTVPFPLGILIASVVSGKLGARWQKQRIIVGVAVLFVAIYALRTVVLGVDQSVDHWDFFLPLFIGGLGLATSIAPLFQTILAGVPPQDAGAGSGALQAIQQAGGALGIAVVSQIFFSTLSGSMAAGATRDAAFVDAMSTSMIYNLVAYVLVALGAMLLRAPDYDDAPKAPVIIE
ncbi:MFS transporter [Pseudooceanicola onchidii]|uniref:MFS transporter n=1 Tax=Pseudooceanicola onchidii TaxID=2562279 RepID=UPI0010AA66B6|nr:MFS transporter [Pseudooceanicola onchidii]